MIFDLSSPGVAMLMKLFRDFEASYCVTVYDEMNGDITKSIEKVGCHDDDVSSA